MSNFKRFALLFSSIGLLVAQSTIEGTVTDTEGNPLAGANVIVDGASVGAALIQMVPIKLMFQLELLVVRMCP